MTPGNLRDWREYFQSPKIHAHHKQWLTPDSKIFMMGSGFAMLIRDTLVRGNMTLYPQYSDVKYDQRLQMFDRIPFEREMLVHFDTFVMRQEIETALGKWPDRDDGFCTIKNKSINKLLQSNTVIQDPYRKVNYAQNKSLLDELSGQITTVIRRGLDEADILIFTLSVTETWRHNGTGKFICQNPNGGFSGTVGYGGIGEGNATFHSSTFAENYENTCEILDMIFTNFPNKKIIICVSPLRLLFTNSDTDVATATLEGKSILRAVAGQVCREYGEKVLYFPSYELAMSGLGAMSGTGNVFEEDGWAVQNAFVETTTNALLKIIS
jgi:hypothetical protein